MTDDQTKDTYPNQGRASGYTDGSGNDVGENIINRVTELMLGPQTKMIELSTRLDDQAEKLAAQQAKIAAQLEETSIQVRDAAKTQEERFDYMLGRMAAHLKKEDNRHDLLAKNELTTEHALASVAHKLDEITGYVQTSVTLAKESKALAKDSLAVGRAAQVTGKQALAIAKKNADQVIEVKKDVGALKKGQSTFSAQLDDIQHKLELADLEQEAIKTQQEAIKQQQDELTQKFNAYLSAEHEALVQDVATLKARIDKLEHGGG